MGLSPGCHLEDTPVTITIGLPGTLMGCKSWLSLAQTWGAGCRWEDMGHSAVWWLEEGPAGPWGCCVGGEACLHIPCVEVTLRANSPKTEGPSMWQCCFLGESPSRRLSSLLSQTAFSISPGEEQSTLTQLGKKKNQRPLLQQDSK